MPLSIFVDALPYTEIKKEYSKWFDDEQVAELQPNIAYSSVLHWQLYCDKYPDDRLKFVDWQKVDEEKKTVRLIAGLFRPIDNIKPLSFFFRKSFDRIIFRRNALANIPFRFRKYFSEQSEYLFWNKDVYSKEEVFKNYCVISQDEGHISFDQTIKKAYEAIENNNKNIFLCIGEIDHQGHMCARGEEYSKRIRYYMDIIHDLICRYIEINKSEEVIIASDHGMSTIKSYIDLDLEKHFGRQSKKTYIAYCDSCIMCVWSEDKTLLKKIKEYLSLQEEGHLLSESERIYYRATNKQFGDLIFILKEGYCFKNNWFGVSIRKHPDGEGMHGFWPERDAKDQMATIILINGKRRIKDFYVYPDAYKLIKDVMQSEIK